MENRIQNQVWIFWIFDLIIWIYQYTNYILKEYIDRIVVVYLDDIFIFNKTLEKYKEYIYFILTALE